MTQQQRDIKRKLAVLEHAKQSGKVAKTCRRFGISRQCFYNWRRAFERRGEAGLVNRGPCPENHALRTPRPMEEKVLHLRLTYHFGPTRIAWYLGRYHGFSISTHGVYNVLVRNGINRLPTSCHKRSLPSMRYQKQVPGPPRPGRREVPASRGSRGPQGTALPVHGDRRRHAHPRLARLREAHPGERDRLHRPRRRAFPVSHPHRQDGQWA
jgi:transposase